MRQADEVVAIGERWVVRQRQQDRPPLDVADRRIKEPQRADVVLDLAAFRGAQGPSADASQRSRSPAAQQRAMRCRSGRPASVRASAPVKAPPKVLELAETRAIRFNSRYVLFVTLVISYPAACLTEVQTPRASVR